MPGFYLELGLIYRYLGYSSLTSRVPALVSFIVAGALLYWIAKKLYGPEVALLAAALFAFFPLNLFYAFTAMMETPLLAVGLAAFAVFVWKRGSASWWLGPVTLALPIFFRESSFVLGLVMAAMLFWDGRERSLQRALACGAISVAVLAALLLSPVGAGRPSMWKANILAQGSLDAVYSDAFALDRFPGSVSTWTIRATHTFLANSHSLVSPKGFLDGWFERTAMIFLLSGVPLGFWMWRRRRDGFALGVAATVTVLLVADLCLYTVWGYRGVRSLLLMQPLVAILWAVAIAQWTRTWEWKRQILLLTAGALIGASAVIYVLRSEATIDAQTRANTSFLESIVGDDRDMVVSPLALSLDYVNRHYPQLWSFVPENCRTMQLLNARYKIGTVIMPAKKAGGADILCDTGLAFAGEHSWRGVTYAVYRNQDALKKTVERRASSPAGRAAPGMDAKR